VNEGQEQSGKPASGKLPPRSVAASPRKTESWFKAMRSADALELIRANPNALVLAYLIGTRARYREGFNADGLGLGDAMLGDYENCGMTRQQHRTALAQLVKWKFATTRATTKGTIARLIDTRLFEVIPLYSNQPNNHQPTTSQPASNQQATTNIEHKNSRTVKPVDKTPRSFIPD
jgi:hypothetical protein